MTFFGQNCRSQRADIPSTALDIKPNRIIIAGNALLERCRATSGGKAVEIQIAPWGAHRCNAIDDDTPRTRQTYPFVGSDWRNQTRDPGFADVPS